MKYLGKQIFVTPGPVELTAIKYIVNVMPSSDLSCFSTLDPQFIFQPFIPTHLWTLNS